MEEGAMKTLLLGIAILTLVGIDGCGTPKSQEASTAAAPASGGVAAVSKFDAGPRAGETPIDEASVAKGEKLFQTRGCPACHAFGRRVTCPDLAGVSMRRTAQWMENQILHPDVMTKQDPISHALFAQYSLQMPIQGLTPEEARCVVEFFKHKDHELHEHH
jgi:hypothetical protein